MQQKTIVTVKQAQIDYIL